MPRAQPADLSSRLGLAISQAKRVERESRILKQMLGEIRDAVQPGGHNGDQHEELEGAQAS